MVLRITVYGSSLFVLISKTFRLYCDWYIKFVDLTFQYIPDVKPIDIYTRHNMTSYSKPLPVLMSDKDRARLEKLQDSWHCSLGEAVRRCISDVSERAEEERSAPRLDQIRENQLQILESNITLRSDLTDLRSRVEAVFPVIKGIEKVTLEKLLEIDKASTASAVRLLAMIRTMQSRPKIEEEVERILSGLE